ncbi:hypothetical protein CEXT_432281 [Caerostris extrusa]|uniref:Uncharacterized protein n=1 Tax=Caerostris extrusa TaxID=172846 RepID=A0AAV4U5H9_CAEEX|nr:hypothetical protein CEXT_432281 [Caerostris extrusa]
MYGIKRTIYYMRKTFRFEFSFSSKKKKAKRPFLDAHVPALGWNQPGDESLITWRTRLYKALLAKTEFSGLIYLKGFSGNGKSESSVDRGPDSLLQLPTPPHPFLDPHFRLLWQLEAPVAFHDVT